MRQWIAVGLLAALAAACGGSGPESPGVAAEMPAAAGGACEPVGELRFICDVIGPEDLAVVPDSDWVIASGNQEGGRIQLVSVSGKTARVLFPAAAAGERLDDEAYPTCPGPIDPAEGDDFRAHGLYLKPGPAAVHTLFVVHHGLRESIEVFELDAGPAEPALTWIGCAVAPEGVTLNAVVALPDGGFATTAPRMTGDVTSGVWEWQADSGWRMVPGSEDVRPNGLEISGDGEWFYVAGWQDERFIRLSRGRTPVETDAVQLGFRPDNLRMAPDGLVYAAGHTDFRTPSEASNVAHVDPETLEFERIFRQPYLEGFAAATTAVPVGGDIWLGTNRGEMIGYFPAPQASAP